MYGLSELEMRIVSELEEAGEEGLQTMAVTVMPGLASSDPFLDFQNALRRLVARDFLRMSTGRDAAGRLVELPQEDSLAEVEKIGEILSFDSSSGRWEDRPSPRGGNMDHYPYIVDTPSGAKMAEKILDARGYQWWIGSRGRDGG